jgi:hypothetical protein
MDRERAKELLPEFTAFANGEEIQYRSKGLNIAWVSLTSIDDEPMWSDTCEYRVEPKPREWFAKPDSDRDEDAGRLHKQNDDCAEFGCIKVREVLEEDHD